MNKKYLMVVGGFFLLGAMYIAMSPKYAFKDAPVLNLPEKNLDIRIFFGYKDARPARFVADRYEAAFFLQRLRDSCAERQVDCGFTTAFEAKAGETDTSVLRKVVTGKDGKKTQVSVRVFTSSAGPDDDENRRNPFQKWKSDDMKNQFARALASADVVLYNGHSRAGGGPDFAVPALTKEKHVHYNTYQKKKAGFDLIQVTLRQNPHTPLKMLGLFSCQSDQLFRKKIEAARPQLKVVGSRQLLYFSDALNESLDQLSQILEKI